MTRPFVFHNPTTLVFGEGSITRLPRHIPQGSRILMVYGGGSIKKNGVYDAVHEALADYYVSDFAGIEPNPKVESIRRAVAQAKEQGVSFVLAVGGGSVIDAVKLIAAAACSKQDPWELVLQSPYRDQALPFGSVLTAPATASEMNRGAVISNAATQEKFSFSSYYPRFAILDPTVPFSLPRYQVACGLADAFVHVMEQYLTTAGQSLLMDRRSEGVLLTLKEIAPQLMQNHQNAELMGQMMLCATSALNGSLNWGVLEDWSTHLIGHEITALTGLTHGHTLAILLPSVWRVMQPLGKEEKLAHYGQRVWDIHESSPSRAASLAIECTEQFFDSLGLGGKLRDQGITPTVLTEIVQRFKERGTLLGEHRTIDWQLVEKILADAY